jgi:hypothetical protein
VLPSFRCSWTNAAHDDWQLPQRCSWYMRFNFPSGAANYRDHSFLRKFLSLSYDNASFAVSYSKISTLSMQFNSSHVNGSQGSIVIITPAFWQETKWSWLAREKLTFLHSLIFAFEDLGASDASECTPLQENRQSSGCC